MQQVFNIFSILGNRNTEVDKLYYPIETKYNSTHKIVSHNSCAVQKIAAFWKFPGSIYFCFIVHFQICKSFVVVSIAWDLELVNLFCFYMTLTMIASQNYVVRPEILKSKKNWFDTLSAKSKTIPRINWFSLRRPRWMLYWSANPISLNHLSNSFNDGDNEYRQNTSLAGKIKRDMKEQFVF